jgi:hypothetical protein
VYVPRVASSAPNVVSVVGLKVVSRIRVPTRMPKESRVSREPWQVRRNVLS